jgi:hypothetical protein
VASTYLSGVHALPGVNVIAAPAAARTTYTPTGQIMAPTQNDCSIFVKGTEAQSPVPSALAVSASPCISL